MMAWVESIMLNILGVDYNYFKFKIFKYIVSALSQCGLRDICLVWRLTNASDH